jgi:hypothetical protein
MRRRKNRTERKGAHNACASCAPNIDPRADQAIGGDAGGSVIGGGATGGISVGLGTSTGSTGSVMGEGPGRGPGLGGGVCGSGLGVMCIDIEGEGETGCMSILFCARHLYCESPAPKRRRGPQPPSMKA